jgi:hypothetical protein
MKVMRESFEEFVERFLRHVYNVIPMKNVASCAYGIVHFSKVDLMLCAMDIDRLHTYNHWGGMWARGGLL